MMKNALWMMGGLCAAVATLVLLESQRRRPVRELAAQLELAWADQHTVA